MRSEAAFDSRSVSRRASERESRTVAGASSCRAFSLVHGSPMQLFAVDRYVRRRRDSDPDPVSVDRHYGDDHFLPGHDDLLTDLSTENKHKPALLG